MRGSSLALTGCVSMHRSGYGNLSLESPSPGDSAALNVYAFFLPAAVPPSLASSNHRTATLPSVPPTAKPSSSEKKRAHCRAAPSGLQAREEGNDQIGVKGGCHRLVVVHGVMPVSCIFAHNKDRSAGIALQPTLLWCVSGPLAFEGHRAQCFDLPAPPQPCSHRRQIRRLDRLL